VSRFVLMKNWKLKIFTKDQTMQVNPKSVFILHLLFWLGVIVLNIFNYFIYSPDISLIKILNHFYLYLGSLSWVIYFFIRKAYLVGIPLLGLFIIINLMSFFDSINHDELAYFLIGAYSIFLGYVYYSKFRKSSHNKK